MARNPNDILSDAVREKILKEEAQLKKTKPFLNKQLEKIQRIDWKISALKAEKEKELLEMDSLLDLAMVSTHKLKNGYKVRPGNRYKVEILDIGLFMKWLKTNKPPGEVFDFLKDAIKLTNLKDFCMREANIQRVNGELNPTIDGVEFGEMTYRKLSTCDKGVRR